ncbi:hypothetical protein EV421DRAFT_1275187 [Armillaria borealis]|uniref:Uncharacterized protein n=1 Tax=Armillaria borealis TaxID=47425 RepID=A0AA39MI79_9AGAR|nr:hypothetical protein EV421DRAFT_1275187 [Armillaria borealis]
MDRSLKRHYDNLLQFTVAIRILSSHEISPMEVKRGCGALCRAVQTWAGMRCLLTPYFHISMHFEAQFLRFGPCPVFGAYPYERNNRTLIRFNKNGHSGGELECTMMRNWWKTTFIQDLITNLESLPRPWAQEDVDSIHLLHSYLKGGTNERRGTLQMYLDRMEAADNPDHIDFPRISNDTELRQSGSQLYRLIFLFLHELWKPYFKLVYDVDMSTARGPTASFAGQVKSFSHLWVEKRRYGAATTAWGQSAQYAYIHGRVPVRIDYLFQAVQSFGDVDYIANLAVVWRFQTDEFTTALQLPWYIWAVDLGVAIWSADQLGHLEVVEMKHLSGHFVLAPIDIHDQGVWVTITYENSPEADINIDEEED